MLRIQKHVIFQILMIVIVYSVANYSGFVCNVQCHHIFRMIDLSVLLMLVGNNMPFPAFHIGLTVFAIIIVVNVLK